MKYLKMLLISFLFVFSLSYITIGSNHVSADDHFEEKYENHKENDREGGDFEEKYENHKENKGEGDFEDIGKLVGWGTFIAIIATGLLFPIRKSAKWIIKNYPKSKNVYISISKLFGKYHMLIGVIALALSIFHGVTMYLSEGSLEGKGIIGLGAVILLLIAGTLGTVLSKNKKAKSLRTAHKTLTALVLLIVFIHIFI